MRHFIPKFHYIKDFFMANTYIPKIFFKASKFFEETIEFENTMSVYLLNMKQWCSAFIVDVAHSFVS